MSEESYLRSSEVAVILHVDPKTIARWASAGKLPCARTLGGHRRYPASRIRALAAAMLIPVTDHRVAGLLEVML